MSHKIKRTKVLVERMFDQYAADALNAMINTEIDEFQNDGLVCEIQYQQSDSYLSAVIIGRKADE